MSEDGNAALLLDLDGTLADSLRVMREVYDRFLERFGKSGSDVEFERLNGPPLKDIITSLAQAHRLPDTQIDLLGIYRGLIGDAYREVRPQPGTELLLKTAQHAGYKICVVTSNSADLTRTWLRRVALSEAIDHIVTGDEVAQGKPNPEPYLLALKRTSSAAHASIAVEDSVAGALSALGAGICTFFLSGTDGAAPDGVMIASTLYDVADFIEVRHRV